MPGKDAGSSVNASHASSQRQDIGNAPSSPIPELPPGPHAMDRGRSRVPRPSMNSTPEHDLLRRRGYHALHSSFGKVFQVKRRWKLIREMGSGAYGHVISAGDEITGETVAIKLVSRVFDKVQLAKRALREITLLRHFTGHANITGLIDATMISPDSNEMSVPPSSLCHLIYRVLAISSWRYDARAAVQQDTEFGLSQPMEADLHQIIKSGQTLTNEHVQYFVYQILRGMKYIHSVDVIHRDLKPGNLLVNADCELKICDFGLSRGFENASHLTEYVATRWYRAPEIMLGFREYDTAIDVWSIGCILAELLSSQPLFKGKDYGLLVLRVHPLPLMQGTSGSAEENSRRTRYLTVPSLVDSAQRVHSGSPEETVLQKIASEKVRSRSVHRKLDFDNSQARAYVRSLPISKKRPFSKILPTADVQAIELLQHMLTFSPESRYSVAQSLEHPWLSGYHEPDEEPDCKVPFDKWRTIERLDTLEDLRLALWNEIQDYRKEVRGGIDDEDDEVASEEADEEVLQLAEGISRLPVEETFASEPEPAPIPEEEGEEEDQAAKTEPVPEPIWPPPPPPPADKVVQPTDPVASYARRSSIMQPTRQGSIYGSPRPPSQQPSFTESPQTAEPTQGGSSIAFPSQGYVIPGARSRTGSTVGRGEGRKLLRTLSTVSIHESAEGLAGGLGDIAPIGRYIVESNPSEADAPVSEMPRILEDEERKGKKEGGGFYI
ncbi:unnamed protein product [Mycena citricolor]|uniref:Protein kinase domain-containing protein n=1 Tax=Mycena citricolor TaxID=2018698 RepID=A0AAD2HD17_9AGAR|nr:unnamed protein product [Mycena citricolor]